MRPATHEALCAEALRAACREMEAALAGSGNERQAIDRALRRLTETAGPELLSSVYFRDHDRLWLVAQSGYEEVRDGFSLDQGIMARAVTTGEVQFLRDVAADPDFIAAVEGIRSEVAVPLGSPAAGVFNVETVGVELPPDAPALFAAAAERIAARVEALRSHLVPDLARLVSLFVYASSLRGVGPISEFAARTLGRLLELESAQIDLRTAEGAYRLASFWRRPDSELKPLAADLFERLARIVEPGEAAYGVVDREKTGLVLDGSARWLVWLPLRVAGEEIGALVGRAREVPSLGSDEVEAAALFAQQAAALIDVATALRREQRAAVTDPLTGLLNRRGFDERLNEELQRAERANRTLALLLIDCDGLKMINDQGGHELGDSALQLVADCLRAQKRAGDVAGRVGGDEFAVLLPETPLEAALGVAERLRGALAGLAAERGLRLTATFGVAEFPGDGTDADALARAADRALYLAKQAGGDRAAAARPVGVTA